MVEKMKTDVDRLLLLLTMKKTFPIYFTKTELFFNFRTRVVHLRLFLSFLPFPKF